MDIDIPAAPWPRHENMHIYNISAWNVNQQCNIFLCCVLLKGFSPKEAHPFLIPSHILILSDGFHITLAFEMPEKEASLPRSVPSRKKNAHIKVWVSREGGHNVVDRGRRSVVLLLVLLGVC